MLPDYSPIHYSFQTLASIIFGTAYSLMKHVLVDSPETQLDIFFTMAPQLRHHQSRLSARFKAGEAAGTCQWAKHLATLQWAKHFAITGLSDVAEDQALVGIFLEALVLAPSMGAITWLHSLNQSVADASQHACLQFAHFALLALGATRPNDRMAHRQIHQINIQLSLERGAAGNE